MTFRQDTNGRSSCEQQVSLALREVGECFEVTAILPSILQSHSC